MKMFFHSLAVKVLAKPFVWANHKDPQTWFTKLIRRAWRAL